VARPELGTKRTCPTTGRKFYDLNRDPIVSPYTGEAIPRASFEPQRTAAAGRARPVVEEEEADVVPAGPEVISLEDVAEGEEAKAGADDDVAIEDDAAATDDTFLEDEEEGGDDVADLIDSDIEDDEET
jgi:uncharacterized protein (TIGR02300 family)